MSHYFVTGATGAVGSALVPELLARGAEDITLLIRADDESTLHRRLEDLFEYWQLGEAEARARQHVHALRGDTTHERFGLSTSDYEALAGRATTLIHCAGAVRMNLPIEKARQSAVGSAQNVLSLARAIADRGTLFKVETVSTVGVGGRLPALEEDWITEPRSFHNTYEQSKAEAEVVFRAGVGEGLPITVHRPSMVVGNSVDGRIIHFQVFYHLCEFLSGRRTLGLFPPLGSARLDVIPSDYVARAIAWSSTELSTVGRVLHVASGDEGSIALSTLREHARRAWRAAGRPVPWAAVTLPDALFRAGLVVARRFTDERSRRALDTLPVFLDYLATPHSFRCNRSRGTLAAAGIEVPHWMDYLPPVLSAYLSATRSVR